MTVKKLACGNLELPIKLQVWQVYGDTGSGSTGSSKTGFAETKAKTDLNCHQKPGVSSKTPGVQMFKEQGLS